MKAQMRDKVVRELLLRRNMALGEFAAALGVTQGLVSLWLGGTRFPRPAHRMAIMKMFKLPFDALFSVVDGEEIGDGTERDTARTGE